MEKKNDQNNDQNTNEAKELEKKKETSSLVSHLDNEILISDHVSLFSSKQEL